MIVFTMTGTRENLTNRRGIPRTGTLAAAALQMLVAQLSSGNPTSGLNLCCNLHTVALRRDEAARCWDKIEKFFIIIPRLISFFRVCTFDSTFRGLERQFTACRPGSIFLD